MNTSDISILLEDVNISLASYMYLEIYFSIFIVPQYYLVSRSKNDLIDPKKDSKLFIGTKVPYMKY